MLKVLALNLFLERILWVLPQTVIAMFTHLIPYSFVLELALL